MNLTGHHLTLTLPITSPSPFPYPHPHPSKQLKDHTPVALNHGDVIALGDHVLLRFEDNDVKIISLIHPRKGPSELGYAAACRIVPAARQS